jgi:hypothetical protein
MGLGFTPESHLALACRGPLLPGGMTTPFPLPHQPQ